MSSLPFAEARPGQVVGRYTLEDEIAAGGMATIHLGRMRGGEGFSRIVAIKRLHPHIAKDPDLRAMLLDEARIVSRIRHTHVVQTLDVVTSGEDVLLVMEYVHGEALHRLARAVAKRGQRIPAPLVVTIVAQALYGLHAAHEARDERGHPLDVVHRDVSPHNILVGADGVARVLDFGVAKARGRIQSTQDGALKGKLAYMPPEQFRDGRVDRRTDIYAASVVLWEMLVGRDLYGGASEAVILARVLEGGAPAPSSLVPGLPAPLDAIVLRGLSLDPAARFSTALEMAEALHRVGFATPGEIGAFVRDVAAPSLAVRADKIQAIERRSGTTEGALPEGKDIAPPPTPLVSAVPMEAAPSPGGPSMATAHTVRRGSMIPPPRSRTSAIAAVAIAGIALAVLLGWILGRSGPPAEEGDPKLAARGSDLPPPSVATSVESPATTTNAVSATSAEPLASSSSSGTPASAAPTSPRAPPGTAGRPRKPRGPDCTPPYTVDADGIRTPKPECL